MGIEILVDTTDLGDLNRAAMKARAHHSTINNIISRVIRYSVSNNIPTFTDGVLAMYLEKLPGELQIRGNILHATQPQGDLLILEQFLLNRRLINRPALKSHLTPKKRSIEEYVADRGFDYNLLLRALSAHGYTNNPGPIKQFVDGVYAAALNPQLDTGSPEEPLPLRGYKALLRSKPNPRHLAVLESYLKQTGQLDSKGILKLRSDLMSIEQFRWAYLTPDVVIAIYGVAKNADVPRRVVTHVINQLNEFSQRTGQLAPALRFYKGLTSGKEKLANNWFQHKAISLLGAYLTSTGDLKPTN